MVVGGGGGGVDVVVVVVTAPPPLEADELGLLGLRFLAGGFLFLVLCFERVLVVDVVVVVFFLLATGVVDPPDPHPAISAAMAMAKIRIRFTGPPLGSARSTG